MTSEIVARLRRESVRRFLDEALLLLGTSLGKRGEWEPAETTLREARSEADALGHRRVLWEILRELSVVRVARGDPSEASRLRDEAARLVLEIADTIDDEQLRANFLARPDVMAVLPTR